MAGTNANFSAAAFRTAIHTAMQMAAPTDPALQVTFLFLEKDEFTPESPQDDDPYAWTETPTAVLNAASSLIVPCAVQYASAGVEGEGGMGEFDASRATLTLLDTDWALVSSADQVLIGGVTYTIDAPGAIPLGLFDATVYTLHVSALA